MSPVSALEKQVALSGNVLVKEYIDDGHSGSMFDCPHSKRSGRTLHPSDLLDMWP